MPTVNLDEDECTMILVLLENRHVKLQGFTDIDAVNEMDTINRLEEKIKEAE